MVCEQLGDHVSKIGNLEVLQSDYMADHSIKTALLNVKTIILNAINNNEVVCLVLLHLRATFDTISHQILLNILKYCFGVDGTVLNWLESYLTDRCLKQHDSYIRDLTRSNLRTYYIYLVCKSYWRHL